MKSALVTGCLGQDGTYLSELLLEKGYNVYGIARSHTTACLSIPQGPLTGIKIFYGDILDPFFVTRLLALHPVDEIYHLAAQSHVGQSFNTATYTADVNALGTLRILESIQTLGLQKSMRFYNACSSEVFGRVAEVPQTENTPFYPQSPYAVSKAFSFWITVNFREAHGLFALSGILFNHESPRRGHEFVTRKITRGVSLVYHDQVSSITLGNLDAKRDWGHARDYVRGIHLMLQQTDPEDIVLATGEAHSVREFAEEAFKLIGLPIVWEGSGAEETGREAKTGEIRVRVDPQLYRPRDVPLLCGSPAKAERLLGWSRDISFQKLVKEMVESDLELLRMQIGDSRRKRKFHL